MKTGSVQNRDVFLQGIADQLGRERRSAAADPEWEFQPQASIYNGLDRQELLAIFKEQCTNIHTSYYETAESGLAGVLKKAVADFGGGSVIAWDDPRFKEFGLQSLMESEWPGESIETHFWKTGHREENIEAAKNASVGITFSDITLAESATAVLFSGGGRGRSVSFLPAAFIAIIPFSTLVPRMTQAAEQIHKMVQEGKAVPSCINFITGPSNSADIEMNLVVGVHGPVKAAYIVVMDK